ncbi:hypothetical protein, partial [Peribacillus simplex]|uniref:hypothetical protein n=1 Tax=Peribacillus simplex TaxID=1478 RepID=UPI003D288471
MNIKKLITGAVLSGLLHSAFSLFSFHLHYERYEGIKMASTPAIIRIQLVFPYDHAYIGDIISVLPLTSLNKL